MQIFVTAAWSRGILTLEVEPSDSIDTVKAKIHEASSLPNIARVFQQWGLCSHTYLPIIQRLSAGRGGGRSFDNGSSTLSDVGIDRESSINLNIKWNISGEGAPADFLEQADLAHTVPATVIDTSKETMTPYGLKPGKLKFAAAPTTPTTPIKVVFQLHNMVKDFNSHSWISNTTSLGRLIIDGTSEPQDFSFNAPGERSPERFPPSSAQTNY